MKVALVHDYLTQYGGAERVLSAFCELFPSAPIFTLIYSEKATGGAFRDRKIITSFLQRIPFTKKHHRNFLLLMPLAIEQFDFSEYDLVLSDTHAYAKGIIVKPNTKHICYCHTPMRYAWDDSHRYIREFGWPFPVKQTIPFFMNYIRLWDQQAAERPDSFIANSYFVAERIKKYYHRTAEVIYPPVNTDFFGIEHGKSKEYFLAAGRFLSYKRFDIIVKAFNKLKLPLKIIGDGPEKKYLKSIARQNIEFLGLVSDNALRNFYANCLAFIFPQEEDFGIAPVEAMASGRPVMAYKSGGAMETVREGVNGIFFEEQTVDSLISAVKKFNEEDFNPHWIRASILEFGKENFQSKIKEFIEK